MPVIAKRVAISLIVGGVATVLIMLVEYQYCMDGSGRGWPFAIIHPAHLRLVPGSPAPTRGDEFFSVLLAPPVAQSASGLSYPPEIHFLAIIGDIFVWSTVAFLIVSWLRRPRPRLDPRTSGE
jgi:hypothetical protein